MKIGILTFIHTNNYGANLQCFALQHTIQSMGYDVDVIDLYRPVDKGYESCKKDKVQFSGIYKYHTLKDYRSKLNKCIASVIKRFFTKQKQLNDKQNGFASFHKQYIQFSNEKYLNFSQIYENFPQSKYSHLITGSDQVWNYSSYFSKEPFFLTFAKNSIKISYAASLGHSSLPPSVKQKYAKWLKDFTAISVREESAVTAISEITKKTVSRVLDPIFLLDKEEWLRSLSINASNQKGYVLVYMLSLSEEVISCAKRVAKLLDSKVKILTNRPYYKLFDDCEFLRTENPKGFVELYCNASFVVTNSFHGTAFALNFNIPFVTIDKQGGRLNTRKKYLLDLFGLSSRYIYEGDEFDPTKLMYCDFKNVNEVLKCERKKSESFLKEALKDEG